MTQTDLLKTLQDRIEPRVEALGYECVELTLAIEAGRRILRVTLDSPHGVKLDECARVSKQLGAELDEGPDLGGKYYLEVSSPGINRALTKPEHFRRFAGERVKIRLREKLEGGTTLSGVLVGLEGDNVTVETTVGPRSVPLDAIARARLHRDVDAILKAAR